MAYVFGGSGYHDDVGIRLPGPDYTRHVDIWRWRANVLIIGIGRIEHEVRRYVDQLVSRHQEYPPVRHHVHNPGLGRRLEVSTFVALVNFHLDLVFGPAL